MTAAEDLPDWGDLKPVPIRVLVKGTSSTLWVSPPGGASTRQTFPWWLGAFLNDAGLPAEVRNVAREAQKISEALCDWDVEVQRWSPDVVILNYGEYECLPGILPRWMERIATGWHWHPGPVRNRGRRRLVKPAWRHLTAMQVRLDRALDPGPYRVRPKRVLRELGRVIDQIQIVGRPLVLVTDPWSPSSRWRTWFPGMEARTTELRAVMRQWVADRANPDVRLFPLSDLVHGQDDLDVALPDGVHFSAKLHREVGEAMAGVILQWAATQPHLQWPRVAAAEEAG